MNRPACCTPPNTHWPLPWSVPGAVLVSSQFDATRLCPEDFAACAIDPPASIQRSVAKRQAEFLAGRLCARAALEQLGTSGWVPAIGPDRAPVWPADCCGAITHAAGWAGAVVARRSAVRGLGLDMESVMSAERAQRLWGEILTADELQRIANVAPEQIGVAVTLAFSLKESLFKALYPLVGQRFYFEHAEVLHCSDDGRARMRLLTHLSQEFCEGAELDAQFSHEHGRVLSLVAVLG